MHLAALILSGLAAFVFLFGGFRTEPNPPWPVIPSNVAGFLLAVAVFLLAYP